ncbi:MAG: peptidoglycan DD-metalloendopeptidase family protein, partial [Acidimicrobiia bacterium]
VHHGGGVRTSYSYLSAVRVGVGQRVAPGAVIGRSGADRGVPALHFSLRLGGRYLDPAPNLGCWMRSPGLGLWLRPIRGWAARPAYSSERATGHPGRHVRPTSHRSPGGG